MRQAEETGRAAFDRLGEQNERLANTNRHLDLAKAHNGRAVDQVKEPLNRNIFRPVMTWNKTKKRDMEDARIFKRHSDEKATRDEIHHEQYESRQRSHQAYRTMNRETEHASGGKAPASARDIERSRYHFEATASDDQIEDQISSNINDISESAGRLETLSVAMSQVLSDQNAKLGKLTDKVDVLDSTIVRNIHRLARIE